MDEVIDEFIESGRCSMVTRADNKKQVLFSPVEHLLHPLVCERASDAMRNLWRGDDMSEPTTKVSPYRDDLIVPKGRDLEELLLRRKVRTADQLDRRKQRHKAAAKQKQEEQEAAACGHRAANDPNSGSGQIPLFDAEYAEGARRQEERMERQGRHSLYLNPPIRSHQHT